MRQVDTAVNDKMFGLKYGPRKNDIGKTSRREVSSPERETVRKGSKSGAPAEIGRYHMYGLLTLLHSEPPKLYGVLTVLSAIGLRHIEYNVSQIQP